MRLQIPIFAVLLVAAVFVGCSGSRSASPFPPSAPAGMSAQADAKIILTIPSATQTVARGEQYISPGTQSVSVSVTGQSGPPLPTVIANVTPQSPACVSGQSGLVCTISLSAPVGADSFTITAYSGLNGSASILSSATVAATISANQPNSVSVTLSGVVASIAISLPSPLPVIPSGYATSMPLLVKAYDASGAQIVGSFANPVTLTNTDTSGKVILSGTTTLTGSLALTRAPSALSPQPPFLIYNGGVLLSPAIIGATASGVVNVTTASFQPNNDRLFQYTTTISVAGKSTDTYTTYSTSTPAPVATTTTTTDSWTYAMNFIPNQTFNGISGIDRRAVTTDISGRVTQADTYVRFQLNPTNVAIYEYGFTANYSYPTLQGASAGGCTDTAQETRPTQYLFDLLPHVAGQKWTNTGSYVYAESSSGACGGYTFTVNLTYNDDGSGNRSETYTVASPQPTPWGTGSTTWTNAAIGTATRTVTNFDGSKNIFTIGLPTGGVIPVTVQFIPTPPPTGTPLPSPAPTTYLAVDWYPGGGAPQQPLRQFVSAQSSPAPLPSACPVPSPLAGVLAQQLVRTTSALNPGAGHTTSSTETVYFIPNVGFVCDQYSFTGNGYYLLTGNIRSNEVYSETNWITAIPVFQSTLRKPSDLGGASLSLPLRIRGADEGRQLRIASEAQRRDAGGPGRPKL